MELFIAFIFFTIAVALIKGFKDVLEELGEANYVRKHDKD